MDKNDEQLDPLNKIRKQILHQQPSEKPANDVLNEEDADAGGESQFVRTTREEVDEEITPVTSPATDSSASGKVRHMPNTDRLTEKD